MNNCLVTKLKGIANNADLLKIGEMRVSFNKDIQPVIASRSVRMTFDKSYTTNIMGGYVTNNNLTGNFGTTLDFVANVPKEVYLSNDNCYIPIEKYNLTELSIVNGSKKSSLNFDIDALKYSKLQLINVFNTNVNGDIASLKGLTSLTSITFNNTNVNGDIASLKGLTSLTSISFNNTNVNGDIASLKGLTSLTSISFNNTNVNGDIANLKDLTNLTSIEVDSVNNLNGNLGYLPDKILFFSNRYGKSKFTWSSSSRENILALENIYCDNIDSLLNDMSSKKASFFADSPRYKTISLIGTRTSASDAAVQTLQSKGYTVSITPA